MTRVQDEAPDLTTRSRPAPAWSIAVATFACIGYLRPGPGTWASVATVLLWYGSTGFVAPAYTLRVAAAAAVAFTLIGIPAATTYARSRARKDPSEVVIDEAAGQMITLIGCPIAWKPLLAALILFRAFDILKPPPVRQFEALPEGAGIMMDDVAAGIYGWVVLQLLLHYGFLR